MGDLLAILTLLSVAAVVLREHYQQCAEDRADRRSLREYEAMRREMSLPASSVAGRCAPASPLRLPQAKR